MEPKTQLDFLIEEFFNTGKLNLNGKDDGITFDQLEVDSFKGKTLLKEVRSAWQQFQDEYREAGRKFIQAKNLPLSTPDWKKKKVELYNDIIRHNEIALNMFTMEKYGLTDKQKEDLKRVHNIDDNTLISHIENVERLINDLPQEDKKREEIEKNRHKEEVLNSEEFKKKQEEGIEQLNTLFAKTEMTADEKSSQYMEIRKKIGIGYIALYYYNIEKGVEEKKEGHYNRALSYFVRAKSQLEDAVRELNVPRNNIAYENFIDEEIRDLSGEYETAHDDILPLFKKDQLILPKDEYWLKLLEKGEGVEVKIETKTPTYGDPYIIFKGIETNSREGLKDVDKETWGTIFCNTANYQRYKDEIDRYGITCDLFKDHPKYYNFKVGDTVKFREGVTRTAEEKKYLTCKSQWLIIKNARQYNDNLKVIQKSDKGKTVTLEYDNYPGTQKEIDFPGGSEGGCPSKGYLKDVQISKLKPLEIDKDIHTYGGIEDAERKHYIDNPDIYNQKLKLSDPIYYMINNELRRFASQLQRLNIKSVGWDFRKEFTKGWVNDMEQGYERSQIRRNTEKEIGELESEINSLNPTTERSEIKRLENQINKLEREINVKWEPFPIKSDTVEGIYQILKDKIFVDTTTEQAHSIIPYLMDVNDRLEAQDSITKSKITDFVDGIDFSNTASVEEDFKQLMKSVSSQYEDYWKYQTLYFEGASDRGDPSFIEGYKDLFNDKIMEIIYNSDPDTQQEGVAGTQALTMLCLDDNPQINMQILNTKANELYNLARKDSYQNKYDIKCIQNIRGNDGEILIAPNDYLDVKSKSASDDFLGELSTPFKDSDFGNETVGNTDILRKKCKAYVSIYNQLIDALLVRLNDEVMVDSDVTMGEYIKNKVLGTPNPFKGLIIKDNIFVPLNSMQLYWSNKGSWNDHRLALRYNINGPVYKIHFDPTICKRSEGCEEQSYTIEDLQMNEGTPKIQFRSDIFHLPQEEVNENIIAENRDEVDNYISEALGF